MSAEGVVPDGYECCPRMGFYCANPPISDFWYGCFAYAVFAILASLICYCACAPKDRGVAVHSAIVGTFCLWLMWGMTWLSQWHPLVYPEYTPENGDDGEPYTGAYMSCLNTTDVETIYWLGDGSSSSL